LIGPKPGLSLSLDQTNDTALSRTTATTFCLIALFALEDFSSSLNYRGGKPTKGRLDLLALESFFALEDFSSSLNYRGGKPTKGRAAAETTT